MKKKSIIFSVFIILISLILISFNFTLNKSEYFFFDLRYEFSTNISGFNYPKKLLKTRSQYYWIDFNDSGSSTSWFETFEIDILANTILLDIKTKYINQIPSNEVTLKDLSIFNLDDYSKYQLFLILQKNTQSQIKQKEVEDFCDNQTDKLLFEKGINKMVKF